MGISPASNCSWPTFRNPVSVPSSKAGCTVYTQPLSMELIQGSETSANYNLTPWKYPKENIQYSNHGESLKSRICFIIFYCVCWLTYCIKHSGLDCGRLQWDKLQQRAGTSSRLKCSSHKVRSSNYGLEAPAWLCLVCSTDSLRISTMQQIYAVLFVHFVTYKGTKATVLSVKFYIPKRLAVARCQV